MEYHSATKKSEIRPFAATWMGPEIIILSDGSQRKTNIIAYFLHVKYKKKKKHETNLLTKQKQTHTLKQ